VVESFDNSVGIKFLKMFDQRLIAHVWNTSPQGAVPLGVMSEIVENQRLPLAAENSKTSQT
jgi:hypothetical protein